MPKRTIQIELDDQLEIGSLDGACAAEIEAENRILRRAATELREDIAALLLHFSRARRLQ